MLGRPTLSIEKGDRFHKLVVIEENGRDRHGRATWLCQCDCGQRSTATATNLRTGRIQSCGCLKKVGRVAIHGHKRSSGASRVYLAWVNMKRRCTDSSLKGWKNYGGRGITYDPQWESFEVFLEDMGEPPPGMSLDRKDNDGPYSKDNCRWADRKTQRLNSRRVLMVKINGEKLPLSVAVERYSSLPYMTVFYRIRRGWDPVAAIRIAKLRR